MPFQPGTRVCWPWDDGTTGIGTVLITDNGIGYHVIMFDRDVNGQIIGQIHEIRAILSTLLVSPLPPQDVYPNEPLGPIVETPDYPGQTDPQGPGNGTKPT
jgi:hypothetical protein